MSDRELRNNGSSALAIYKQQCEELANDTLEDADMNDMAKYSCCFCHVNMLKVQWHICSECGGHVHGFGIGCVNRDGICKACKFTE